MCVCVCVPPNHEFCVRLFKLDTIFILENCYIAANNWLFEAFNSSVISDLIPNNFICTCMQLTCFLLVDYSYASKGR